MAPNTGERGRKEVLRAEDARAALRFMAMTAAEGGWRAVVVEELDRAEREVAPNILLKTLEEPPPRTVLLLVTSAPDRLLPTIRSRCRRLDLAPLARGGDVTPCWPAGCPSAPRPSGPASPASPTAAPAAPCCWPRRRGWRCRRWWRRCSPRLPRLDPRRVQDIAERVTARRDAAALGTFMALLRRALAAGLRQAARGAGAAPWLGGRSLAEWSTLWEKLGRLADETERLNLDRKQAVLSGLGMLSVR